MTSATLNPFPDHLDDWPTELLNDVMNMRRLVNRCGPTTFGRGGRWERTARAGKSIGVFTVQIGPTERQIVVRNVRPIPTCRGT